MKNLILLTIILALFAGCKSVQETEEPEPLTVAEFLFQADELLNTEVTVIGKADHICMHSQSKIHFVCPEHSDESFKLYAGDDLEYFNDTLIGQIIIVKGTVEVDKKIDHEYLDELEAKLAEKEEKAEKAECLDKEKDKAEHHEDEGEDHDHYHHHHRDKHEMIAKYREQVDNSLKGSINIYKIVVSEILPVPEK